MILFAENKI